MENINILYIDDKLDPFISEYLYDDYKYEGLIIEYKERSFEEDDTYKSLLCDSDVRFADIIIIDSMLFENSSLFNGKLAGEEFEVIIRQVFPFKEVIVVTQNDITKEYKVIKKFDSSSGDDKEKFFETKWKPMLDKAVENIQLYRKLFKRIKEKNYVETYFFEELQQSIQGESGYDRLTVKDIDKIITLFEEIKSEYDNQ